MIVMFKTVDQDLVRYMDFALKAGLTKARASFMSPSGPRTVAGRVRSVKPTPPLYKGQQTVWEIVMDAQDVKS